MSQFWRTSFLTGVSLFLEGCALYLVFSIITALIRLPEARLALWLVLLALLWSYLLSLYVQTIRFSLNLRGMLGLLASVLSVLFLANLSNGLGLVPVGRIMGGDWATAVGAFLTLAFLVALWWRGTSIAHDDVTLDTIRGAFQWGMAVVFAAVLIDSFTPADVVNGVLVLAFFGIGLAGLSLARFSWEASDPQSMSRDWLIPIGVSVGGVLLLALMVSLLGMWGLDELTRSILKMVGTAGLWVLKPLLLGLGFVAAALVAVGNWLTSFFGGGDLSGLESAQEGLRQFHESLEDVDQTGPPRLLIALLKGAAFLAAVTLGGWILFRIFRFRKLWQESLEVEETRESLFSWERANRDLASLLNGWWAGLMPGAKGKAGQRPEPQDPRELYHNFLILAEESGHPKAPAETPKEHQRNLGWTLPPEPVARIVDGFQLTHYGNTQVAQREMERLLHDWSGLRQYAAERQQTKEEGAGTDRPAP